MMMLSTMEVMNTSSIRMMGSMSAHVVMLAIPQHCVVPMGRRSRENGSCCAPSDRTGMAERTAW